MLKKSGGNMKYDCSDEFDLTDIFRKLTSGDAQNATGEAFFEEEPSLAQFQQAMDRLSRWH